jgi:hypothetical protein
MSKKAFSIPAENTQSRLSDGVNVEWLPRLLKHVNQATPRNHRSRRAATARAVNFRKRPQNC